MDFQLSVVRCRVYFPHGLVGVFCLSIVFMASLASLPESVEESVDVCRALLGIGYIIFSPWIRGVFCLSILFTALASLASLPESVHGR